MIPGRTVDFSLNKAWLATFLVTIPSQSLYVLFQPKRCLAFAFKCVIFKLLWKNSSGLMNDKIIALSHYFFRPVY